MAFADFLGEGLGGEILRGIFKLFAAAVGWVYLWVRYRSRVKVKYALVRKYNRSYVEAGGLFIAFVLQIVVLFAGVVILGGMIYALCMAFLA